MVAKASTLTDGQTAAREAVTAVIVEAAEDVLAGWEDDRLLGQMRARTIVQVTRAVRISVGRGAPDAVAQVTPWRLRRLIDEVVSGAVSRAQGQALRRRYANEEPSESFLEYEIGEPINGVTVIGINFNPSEDDPQDTSCSADE